MFKSNNNSRLTQGISLAILGIGLLGSVSVHAEKYYKWVDDAGSTHYTQMPPPKAYIKKSVLVDIVPTPPSSTPAAPVVNDLNQNNNPLVQGNHPSTSPIGITPPPEAATPPTPPAR